MEAPKIAERIKFWQEQDRINQALIPRVLINGGRNGGRCVPTRLLLGWRLPCPASPVWMRRTPSTM